MLSIFISVLFAEIYTSLNSFIHSHWISAASINTVLTFVVLLVVYNKKKHISKKLEVNSKIFLEKSLFKSYTPAVLILLGIILGSSITSFFGSRETISVSFSQIAWIFWIPIIEEFVFRVGVGNFFRSISSVFWGSYFSVFIFAFVHSNPTIERILSGDIGVPMGPLLLGALCEYIYLKSGKISPAIVFHAVCNSSGVLYSLIDSRWLTWLGGLYQ